MAKSKTVTWKEGQKRRVQCIYIDAKSIGAWDKLVADVIKRQQRGEDATISGIVNALVMREYGTAEKRR